MVVVVATVGGGGGGCYLRSINTRAELKVNNSFNFIITPITSKRYFFNFCEIKSVCLKASLLLGRLKVS